MNSTSTLRAARLILAILALGLVGGCGIFSPEETKEPGGSTPDFKDLTAKDDVPYNLTQAYLQRDIDQYRKLQHPSFLFQFPADEFDLAGTADGRWEASRDLQSTDAMLSGEPNKDGRILQDIELTLTPKDLIWSPDVEPEFEGSLRRTYTVQMDVEVSGNLTYQVRGQQEFYIQQVEVDGKQLWKLRFWRDLGVELTKAEVALAG